MHQNCIHCNAKTTHLRELLTRKRPHQRGKFLYHIDFESLLVSSRTINTVKYVWSQSIGGSWHGSEGLHLSTYHNT